MIETEGSADGPSRFLSEVLEQPAALKALVRHYRGAGRWDLAAWARLARAHGRIRFAGMGSSAYAPQSVLAALADLGIDADVEDAGELLHYPRPCQGVLALVSQSGESAETRALAERCQRRAAVVALINDSSSTVARAAALVLPLVAGREAAIAAKTYVNTLALLHLMAAALSSEGAVNRALDRLDALAASMTPPEPAALAGAAALLARGPYVQCIGRGPGLVSARQTALTLMEGAGLEAAALSGGAFRHGPLELAGRDHAAVFFIAGGETSGLLVRLAGETALAGSRALVVTDLPGEIAGAAAVLHVPSAGENLFPLACASAHAHLVDAVARQRGRQAGVWVRCRKVTDSE